MTLFKKYYKEANNDISADEALINKVIENVRKKQRFSYTAYYKYAITAAAAIVVLSVTAVALPQLNSNDEGVISVVTETAPPDIPMSTEAPSTFPAETIVPVPVPSLKTESTGKNDKKEKNKTAENVKADDYNEEKTSAAVKTEPEEKGNTENIPREPEAYKAMFSFGMSSDSVENDINLRSAEDEASVQETVMEDKVDNTSDIASTEAVIAGGGVAASGAADKSAANKDHGVVMPEYIPEGYYISEMLSSGYVLSSDGGGKVIVIIEDTEMTPGAPIYSSDNTSVSFISNGKKFNISYENTEKSVIDELIKSFR